MKFPGKNKISKKTLSRNPSQPEKESFARLIRRRITPKGLRKASPPTPLRPDQPPDSKQSELTAEEAARRRLLVKSPEFNGIFYYNAAQRFWSLMFASLLIDAALLWYGPKLPQLRPFSYVLDSLAIALMGICLISLKRESLLEVVDNIRHLQGRIVSSGRTSTILVLLFVAVTLSDIVLKAGKAGLVPLLLTIGLMAVGLPSLIRNFKEKLRRNLELKSDLLAWVPYVNRQTLLINIIPLACARLIALAGTAKSLMETRDPLNWFPFLGASLAFLLILRPEKKHFVIHCPRCAAWTARALKSKRVCPACDPDRFLTPSSSGI